MAKLRPHQTITDRIVAGQTTGLQTQANGSDALKNNRRLEGLDPGTQNPTESASYVE